ncbi:MAG TPA: hypothetical protein VFD92_11820 [Candidatus Binatia bacterium]|nr:hypothetical protein [Candidatus Binatia bacterium]
MLVAIALTVFSVVLMLAGGLAMLRASGRVERRSGPEVGRAVVEQSMAEPPQPGELASARRTAFRGKAASVEAETSLDMAEFKRLLLARRWSRVLPSLLMIAGMLGFMIFGAVALLIALDQKLTGALMLLVALYAVVRIARDFARA